MSQIDQFEMEVLVHGKPVQEYFHKGNQYIEGKEGTEFSLRFRNRSGNRVLFVPTIDGLSVMDGKKASFKSSGYIVDAYSSETIDGWRTSDSNVARFFFAKMSESYAEQKGEGENVGVVGCAVFKERTRVIIQIVKEYIPRVDPYYPRWPWVEQNVQYSSDNSLNVIKSQLDAQQGNVAQGGGHTNSVVMCCSSTETSAGIGTGFGEIKYAPVQTVEFDRATDYPFATFTIYYNTRHNLEKMGVEFKRLANVSPSAFPNESGYCKPPEGWRK